MQVLSFSLGLAVCPLAAEACSFSLVPALPVDREIKVAADGSFVDASWSDNRRALEGSPIVNIGGGRTGQVITQWGGCSRSEQLLFVDCTTAEGVLLEGERHLEVPEIAGGSFASVAAIQPPLGPIGLRATSTVSQVVEQARTSEIGFETNVSRHAAARGNRNAYDPYFGCKLYYPDSAGALQ